MRFMGFEEDGVVAVSRTNRLGLVSIFAAGVSSCDIPSSSKGGREEKIGSDKGKYSGT
jgi:hypothetical protein